MKNVYKPFLLFCCFALAASLSSCDNCKQDYDFYSEYAVDFNLVDENGKDLLQTGVNRYHKDTIKIYDEELKSRDFYLGNDGVILFEFLSHTPELEEPINTPIGHTYYLYLEEGDYDTLSIAYRIDLDECQDRILTQWSGSYNDSLYIEFLSNPPDSKYVSILKESTTR